MTLPAGTTHLFLPDTQCKPGEPMDHLRWAGQYMLDIRPDKVIHAGDHFDFPSLSSYDRGKKAMEGRRVQDDIEAGNEGFRLLNLAREKHNFNQRIRNGDDFYDPDLWYMLGNHEFRLQRAIDDDARMDGLLSFDQLEHPGWKMVPFLEPLVLDGVIYAHYFYNPMTGRPYGGQNIDTRLKTIGHTFTMGHQQGLWYGLRDTIGGRHHGLVAGQFYLHDEEYLGPQGNASWRGLIVKHEVRNGTYDPMFVSMGYLCRRYEGVNLHEFLNTKYPEMNGSLWRAPL